MELVRQTFGADDVAGLMGFLSSWSGKDAVLTEGKEVRDDVHHVRMTAKCIKNLRESGELDKAVDSFRRGVAGPILVVMFEPEEENVEPVCTGC